MAAMIRPPRRDGQREALAASFVTIVLHFVRFSNGSTSIKPNKVVEMKIIKLLAMGTMITTLGGCAAAVSPVGNGFLFTSVAGPVNASDNEHSSKTGESCAANILGIVAGGNASIDAAKQKGNISKVSSVDYRSTTVLGMFSQSCTIVKGE
ncbi:TRL-like family protein [Isoalcanivorax pacificus]|nr:TRL-like family protein [Isoalcanivorax pacificus]